LLQRQDEVLACPAQLIAIKLGDRGDFQLPAQRRDAIPDSAGELRGAFQDALAREAGIPDFKRKDTAVSGGLQERARARSALKELVLALREVAVEAQEAFRRSGQLLGAAKQNYVSFPPRTSAAVLNADQGLRNSLNHWAKLAVERCVWQSEFRSLQCGRGAAACTPVERLARGRHHRSLEAFT